MYPQVLEELRAGEKRSHWMWFIFPQIAGLGHSATARRYAIEDLEEAREYLADRVLGPRLADATGAVLAWAGRRSAQAMFGRVDALKFASSMTLFEAAGGGELFGRALDDFFSGQRDPQTLELLGRPGPSGKEPNSAARA